MQPIPYIRRTDFTDFTGDDTDHNALNGELDAVSTSINQTKVNLAKLQKDDGGLMDGVVTGDSLAESAFASISYKLSEVEANAKRDAGDAANSAKASQDASALSIAARIAAEAARNAASLHAGNAETSYQLVLSKSNLASGFADAASAKATEAANVVRSIESSASNAASSATAAAESQRLAAVSADSASRSASTSLTSATSAANSAQSALTHLNNASVKAAEASGSASTATTKAAEASGSASETQALLSAFQSTFLGTFASDSDANNFATSKGFTLTIGMMYKNTTASKIKIYRESGWGDYDASAQQSQNEASLSAASASASAATATTRATAASTSAAAASSSAATATTKASEASTSALNAAASASDAANSATASATSAISSAGSFKDFTDKYRGALSSAPTERPGGGSLQEGDLFFSSSTKSMKVWNGSAWADAYASLSGSLVASNNLSDLASAETARQNLGLVIGTNVLAANGNALTATTASTATTATTATNATTATTATKLKTASWTIEESSGNLYFIFNGTNKARLDSSGNISVVGNVSAFDSI